MGLIGFPFSVMVSDAEEKVKGTDPAAVTEELSWQKAHAVAAELVGEEEAIIIGADTVVAVGNQILGKPASVEEARSTICMLQGKEHMVYTGVTILVKDRQGEKAEVFFEGTKVMVAPMNEQKNHMTKQGHMGYRVFSRSISRGYRGIIIMLWDCRCISCMTG